MKNVERCRVQKKIPVGKVVRGRTDLNKIYKENAVSRGLKKCVVEAGGMIRKNHPLTTDAGIPDYIVHFRGRTYYVEAKTTGEKCSEQQIEYQKRLKACGIDTYVLDKFITNIFDLTLVCYTTYESKYYKRNPHRPL